MELQYDPDEMMNDWADADVNEEMTTLLLDEACGELGLDHLEIVDTGYYEKSTELIRTDTGAKWRLWLKAAILKGPKSAKQLQLKSIFLIVSEVRRAPCDGAASSGYSAFNGEEDEEDEEEESDWRKKEKERNTIVNSVYDQLRDTKVRRPDVRIATIGRSPAHPGPRHPPPTPTLISPGRCLTSRAPASTVPWSGCSS